MEEDDRERAVYLNGCLRYVERVFMTNTALQERFGIDAQDRAGLERLLRYCARPLFALQRLRKAGSELIYRCAKQHSEPGSGQPGQRSTKRGAKSKTADQLYITPMDQIARLAALVPPPRAHGHRYDGELAPLSPLRAAVVALAAGQTAGAGAGTTQPEPSGVPATA